MKPINVICFYWQGERWREEGMDYDKLEDVSFHNHQKRVGRNSHELVIQYINNLYAGISKWAIRPFNFICFTNDDLEVDEGIEIRPFEIASIKGVLPRMHMFSEAAGLFGSQVFCLDIDVVITGSLEDIMAYNGLFCVRQRWQRGQTHLVDGDIMSFTAGKETEDVFWKPFIKDIKAAEKLTEGRERFWIKEVAQEFAEFWHHVAPGQIVSYKHHVLRDGLQDARVVSCHGHPRPHKIEAKWRMENWKMKPELKLHLS